MSIDYPFDEHHEVKSYYLREAKRIAKELEIPRNVRQRFIHDYADRKVLDWYETQRPFPFQLRTSCFDKVKQI